MKWKILLSVLSIFLFSIFIEIALTLLSTEFEENNKQNAATILVIGESTSSRFFTSWPSQLEDMLKKRFPDKAIKIVSTARPGADTAHIMSRLSGELDMYRPKIVISMMGINDRNLYLEYREHFWVHMLLRLQRLHVYKLGEWIYTNLTKPVAPMAMKNDRNDQDTLLDVTKLSTARRLLDTRDFVESKKIIDEMLEINSRDLGATNLLLNLYFRKREHDMLVKTAIVALEIFPDNPEILSMLAKAYIHLGKESEALDVFNRLLSVRSINHDETYLQMGLLHMRKNNLELALKYLEWEIQNGGKAIAEQDSAIRILTEVYIRKGLKSGEIKTRLDVLTDNQASFNLSNDNANITQKHYQLLYTMTKNKGIQLVVMQYPTLPIRTIKKYLAHVSDVVYVSNEENFRKALLDHVYSDLFVDHLTDRFGHTTQLGDELIARSAAENIIPLLERAL